MESGFHRRVKEVFLAARQRPPNEREECLDDLCGKEIRLRTAVLELLGCEREGEDAGSGGAGKAAGHVSGKDTASLGTPEPSVTPRASQSYAMKDVPKSIGPYRILSVLGEGGMGTVFLAEQRGSLRRRVALKLIKRGMDTREVVGRFDRERQLLAGLAHPNIATVHDAGAAEDGRPFFVMELVQGLPISEYCDRHRLSLHGRLELFRQVSEAMDHAHRRGVVHRDIKPSNILVVTPEDRPTAKVIDFGVAKATNQRLTEKTVYTEVGRIIGTPHYMSPEQTEADGENIDARTDIYSLGVVLYELLVGESPLDWQSMSRSSIHEVLRRIREDEPPTPSQRWSRLNEEARKKIAAERDTDVVTLSTALRNDLDWIAMRAIEKPQDRRYASAEDLAADVERYLKGRPVEARPPSATYRLQKFARRHRTAVLTISAVVLTLLIGLVTSTVLWQRAENHAEEAQRNFELAEAREREKERHLANARRQTYYARLTLAIRDLDSGNFEKARVNLEGCPEEYRGWEWAHLQLRRDSSLRVFRDVVGGISTVAVRPDGRGLVYGALDNSVTLLVGESLLDGEVRKFVGRHAGPVSKVVFDPEGQRIASTSKDGVVRIWDAHDLGLIDSISLEKGFVTSASFDASGDRIAISPAKKPALIYDLRTREARELEFNYPKELFISTLVFGPRGERVAAGFTMRNLPTARVQVLEPGSGKPPLELVETGDSRLTPPVFCVAFHPDGQSIAAGCGDGHVRVWGLDAPETPRLLSGHEGIVYRVEFSRDGALLASVGADRTARVWDVKTWEPVSVIHGHAKSVKGVGFHPDGDFIATASDDGEVRLWSIGAAKEVVELSAHQSKYVSAVAFAPGDTRFASVGYDGRAVLWNAKTGENLRVLSGHDKEISALAFHPVDGRLVTASLDAQIRVWTGDDSIPARVLTGHTSPIRSLAFSGDGGLLASGGLDRAIHIWDTSTWESRLLVGSRVAAHQGSVRALAFVPGVARLVSGSDDRSVRLWDVSEHREIRTLAEHARTVTAVAVDRAGRLVASASVSGLVLLSEIAAGTTLAELGSHAGEVTSLAFSPDGLRLVSCGTDGTLRVWEIPTGRLLHTLRRDGQQLRCVTFSHDGRRILCGTGRGRLIIWESEGSSARALWRARSRGSE